jgi:probable HAF family extracellular repeat protein
MQDLGTLGGTRSSAFEGNLSGQIAGGSTMSTSGSFFHAFLWERGKMIDLKTLVESESLARAINAYAQVVGHSTIKGNKATHAFIWEAGKMMDLNKLIPDNSGWKLIIAHDINDKGQIVGEGIFNGETRAFLLNPVIP